jgi:hypothetical protein
MRKYLIAVMALAAVAAFASVGTAFGASANTSTVTGHFNPDNPGATADKGGLFIETTTLHDTDGGTPTNPTVEPVPTTTVDLNFDGNLALAVGAVPTCGASLSGTTQAGMINCGASYIGGGYSTVCASSSGPGGATGCDLGVINAQVAAYNGPRNATNQPTIRLQAVADHTAVGPLTVVLEGSIRNSNLGGQFTGGKRVLVPVPLLPPAAPGAAAITDFSVNINNSTFVKGSCGADGDWDYRAKFTYSAGTDTVNDSQPCT